MKNSYIHKYKKYEGKTNLIMSGGSYKWESFDPQYGFWTEYDSVTSNIIETAFQAGQASVPIMMFGRQYTINFITMTQDNPRGSRQIQRIPNIPQPTPSRVGVPPAGLTQQLPSRIGVSTATLSVTSLAQKKERLIPSITDMQEYQERKQFMENIEKELQKYDAHVANIEKNIGDKNYREDFSDVNFNLFRELYEELFEFLWETDVQNSVPNSPADMRFRNLFGQNYVPEYYANVGTLKTGEPISQFVNKFVFGICGFKNILMNRPYDIYYQLRRTHFDGDSSKYRPTEGVNVIRDLFGTAIDLDTKISEFAEYDFPTTSSGMQSMLDSIKATTTEGIAEFIKMTNMRPSEIGSRNLDINSMRRIPIVSSHTGRNMSPAWIRQNPTNRNYEIYINFTQPSIVIDLLLKLPVLLLEGALYIYKLKHCCCSKNKDYCSKNKGCSELNRQEWIDLIRSIGDGCINYRFFDINKKIEELKEKYETCIGLKKKKLKIREILGKIEMENTAEFVKIVDDDEYANKILEILEKNDLREGVDDAGNLVEITLEHIQKYMAAGQIGGKQKSIRRFHF
jgi:hypothetical protein